MSTLSPSPFPQPQPQPQKITTFCYLYIKQSPQAWTCLALIFIGLLLLAYVLLRWKKINQNIRPEIRPLVVLNFAAMVFALIVYFIKVVIAEVIFLIESQPGIEISLENGLIASRYQFVTLCILNFMLRSIILLVPTAWFVDSYRRLESICNYIQNQAQNNPQQSQKILDKIKFQQKLQNFLSCYFPIRLIITVTFILIYISRNIYSDNQNLVLIIVGLYLVESIVLVGVLGFGAWLFKKNPYLMGESQSQNQNQNVHQNNNTHNSSSPYYKTLKCNFFLLLLVIILRFIAQLYYFIVEYNVVGLTNSCTINGVNKLQYWEGILDIGFETLFTVFGPIFVVLKIYKYQCQMQNQNIGERQRQRERQEMLESSASNRPVFGSEPSNKQQLNHE